MIIMADILTKYNMNQQLLDQINISSSPYKQYWLNQLKKFTNNKAKCEQISCKIEHELKAITLRAELLKQITISYPPELPVSQEVEQIKSVITNNQVTIVCGETGSGKTTQLPKILLELGYGINGLIGHTQPRRIAARSLTNRINQELGCDNQEHGLVACKMRFHDRTTPATAVKLMTDGILLQEIQNDKLLLQYTALIIDEVHERSLNIDFILGYLKQLLSKRPDLKIIVTSATLETGKLSSFFNNAPVINVSGKTYPVDIIYQPLNDGEEDANLNQGIYQAIVASLNVERGNGLVFLPGEREIKDCLSFLRKTELRNYELLPLFARQNNEAQAQIFNDSGRIKIILATNIAETSLTIPGIKFVIDSGLAKVKRYSIRNRVEQLLLEPGSQASASQRAGRAGRISHGLCVRLFAEADFKLRKPFTEPELLRSNLANVILRMLSLNIGDPLQFQFLDQPEAKAFNDGYRTLFQVEAIDADNRITPLGKKLAQIPTDVQLARILLASAEKYNCLEEALVIVSFLAIQDPRETPLEQQQLARERHQLWADKQSSFMQMLNLWKWYHHELEHKKSNKKLAEVCHKQFVSLVRLREWHELHRQLKEIMANLGYKPNGLPPAYRDLHSAILHGFVVNIGQKDLVDNYYLGTNSKKFFIHPGELVESAKWMVAGSLVETSRLYARNCAQIEPQWLNLVARHLYKYTYSNQRWDKKRGEVVATKSSMLYGLLIDEQKVSYGKINQEEAREIFIKEGLVPNELNQTYKFINHNQQIIKDLEKLEEKLRTYFLLIDDELYQFYIKRLPEWIVDQVTLNEYLANSGDDSLKIDRDEFIASINNDSQKLELFPDNLINNEQKIKLRYVFDHDSHEDGVIAMLDISQIAQVDERIFEWLVPGLIRDKISFMLKALPKNQRLQFNPLADTVTEFLEQADITDSIANQLQLYARKRKIEIDYQTLSKIEFPKHLCCHFRIYEDKKIVKSGDDLIAIKKELAPRLSKLIVKHSASHQINNLTGFLPEFADLLQEVKLSKVSGYYSLIAEKDSSVTFGVVGDLNQAQLATRRGFILLVKQQLKEQIKYLESRKIPDFNKVSLAFHEYYSKDKLSEVLVNYIINQSIVVEIADGFPMADDKYTSLVARVKQNISELIPEVNSILNRTAALYQQIKLSMEQHPLQEEIELQLSEMFYENFLNYTKWQHLLNFPRYLQAIVIRIDKYGKSIARDNSANHEVSRLYDKWYNYVDDLEARHKVIKPEFYDFKYKIEELRISLFAQELKTLYPVSAKRLNNELEQLYLQHLAN